MEDGSHLRRRQIDRGSTVIRPHVAMTIAVPLDDTDAFGEEICTGRMRGGRGGTGRELGDDGIVLSLSKPRWRNW
jgi:hypothetical protein